ncbi:bifunctional helix-turn-helix transcriptional regulator/GNAT family N-acetyltransferase [Hymenobacter coccineus]|nr:GNAT family N-acetyltransferase [Hymenobacter coccineus]
MSEQLTVQSAEVYALYHLPLEPRWFPVFYTVAEQPGQSIGELAQHVGHTHAAVSQVVKELVKQGLVTAERGAADLRRSVIRPTEKGAALWPALQAQAADVRQATDALLAETRHNLWLAIGEAEHALSRRDLPSRVKAVRDRRVGHEIELLAYASEYQADFKRLNLQWIERYFRVEPADLRALDHPEEYILARGGYIALAAYQGTIVGACALLRMDAHTYELAKMAVAPDAQGLGIGLRLGQAVVAKARALGATRLYLESNTRLGPALNLYYKLGFQKTVAGTPSPYERCNIQMELFLT